MLNHLAALILLRSTTQGDQSAAQGWGYQSMSPGEAFAYELDGQVLGCVATLQEWATPVSPVSPTCAAGKGNRVHPTSAVLGVPPLMGDFLDLPRQVQDTLFCWAQFHVEKGK